MAIPRFRKRLFRCKCSLKLMKMICFCAFWWWWWLKSSPSDVHNNKCSPRQIYRWLNMNIKPLLSRWNTLLVLLRVIMMTTMIGYKSRRYLSNFLTKSSCCDLQSLTFKLQTSQRVPLAQNYFLSVYVKIFVTFATKVPYLTFCDKMWQILM